MRIAVFGAGGSMGRPVVRKLCERGEQVWAFAKDESRAQLLRTQLDDRFANYDANLISYASLDVSSDFWDMQEKLALVPGFSKLEGVVYLVGHCPDSGMQDVVSTPLSQMSEEDYLAEFDRHVLGLHKVISGILPRLAEGARIVVVNSAINHMVGLIPKHMHAGHYASAKAAQASLVRALRSDPEILKHNVKLQLLEVGAADTPFHRNAPTNLQSPACVPLEKVVTEIVAALSSKKIVDKQVVPFKQRIGEIVAYVKTRLFNSWVA